MKKGRRYILITVAGSLAIVLLIAVCCLMPFFNGILTLKKQAEQIVRSGSRDDFTKSKTSVVYDCNNEVLMTYSGGRDLYYVKSDEIPQIIKDAFIVMEDREFYSHNGIDVKAIVRAALANHQAGEIVQGASTITQQVARNIYLNQDVNWERKILEAFMAMELEKKYSKEDILEFYLNNIYFGNGYYGIEAASNGYFNKSVGQLTVGEAIFLAAIPNNPSRYEPINHEENTVERSRRILRRLYDDGKISDLDYLLLSGEEENPFVTKLEKNEFKQEMNQSTADTYIYTYVTYCAVRYLMQQRGFTFKNDFATQEELENYDQSYDAWYAYCQQDLYGGGYHIYTSLNPEAQRQLQATVDRVISENDGNLQAAAVSIDNDSGNVTAIVGGKTEKIDGYGFNRAYQSFRQPGSAVKPLNVYAPYLCMGHSTEELVYDAYDANGPKNAEGVYAGEMTLREALMRSKNTIAWQIYRFITPQTGCDYLMQLGFKRVYVDKKYMSGALGGFTYGVSTEEMTAAFHTIYNDGVYQAPTCIRGIYREITPDVTENKNGVRVYTENASRLLTSMLRDVIEKGTGKSARLTNHAAAGKTGTTNGNKDMWFVGYTAYYTTGVWVGYDLPREISMKNGNLACTIWHDYMEQLHLTLSPRFFADGKNVTPEINADLTELMKIPYEPEEGEPDFENLWDNDLVADIMEKESGTAPGDGDAALRGDENGTATGDGAGALKGDENGTVPGDGDAALRGDENGTASGDADGALKGDESGTVSGDANAALGGDKDGAITGGDKDADVSWFEQ